MSAPLHPPGPLRRAWRFFWRLLDASRRAFFNLVFLFLVALFLIALFTADEKVPEQAVLVLDPSGELVEERTYDLPLAALLGEAVDSPPAETRLRDLVEVLDLAREDGRIRALYLDLDRLQGAGTSKLQEVGAALLRFKESGKPVLAYGDAYSQNQYYLAAHADELYMHPMGAVLLTGYGVYRTYLRAALEKLRVRLHVFRVGAYKTAVEPLLRDDMSPEARTDHLHWLGGLWQAYARDVGALRGLHQGALDDYANHLDEHLRQTGGDAARLALEKGLVDALKSREELHQRLAELAGEDEHSTPRRIRFNRYLEQARLTPSLSADQQVGVIVARGPIVHGEAPAGAVSGRQLAELFERARGDEKIRAVVLRIDSGGGSALASETARQALLRTREAGLEVVVSMSSVAASGAYWIAAPATEIWAAPTTLTGSIGIFGALPTFEESLDALGMHTDGVGTTRLSGAFDPTRPLDPVLESALQQFVEHGYRRFVSVVAEGRHMRPEEVDSLAQGRVWTGSRALELGLVDHLGGLQEAVQAAARRAGLEDYATVYVEKPLSPKEEILRLLSDMAARLEVRLTFPARRLLRALGDVPDLALMDDPRGLYAWCPVCGVP